MIHLLFWKIRAHGIWVDVDPVLELNTKTGKVWPCCPGKLESGVSLGAVLVGFEGSIWKQEPRNFFGSRL